MHIRTGGPGSDAVLLNLLDGAVAWLTARGRTDQWGTEPWSRRPGAAERAARVTAENLVLIAEAEPEPGAEPGADPGPGPDGAPLGICVLADRAPEHLPPAGEPELFVRWLVTDPAHRGAGIGAALVAEARRRARGRGVGLLRVDCYAGGGGRLVAQYERLGFTRTASFTEDRPTGPWPGQLLELRTG
ncbi:GNAT family N-acetyltransferase [Kitasatospora phosalacinea]|uniref:GCN5 family N-acetyltransferase n=1 Tax=Kitasatospora phosalacinea TaxID=2065 RepID=A0A9W6PHM4_9ACTN|nr:GNAT family N-acetyltransferase [Kitasatospora phosalacinea]GLW55281.1 GCN5 family N-acetyltransferase [Kitasatospora phosalacinea]